jgi:hypothetical protein
MVQILIIVDNLRIGGVQRIALDQAYISEDFGFKTSVLTLEKINTQNAILSVDNDYFNTRTINIKEVPKKIFHQFKFLLFEIKKTNPKFVLCHSARSNLIVYLIRIVTRRQFQIYAFIHQLPTMCSFKQNLKRAFYWRYADKVTAVSIQFLQEIERIKQRSKFWKFIYNYKIQFDRTGVYIPRLEYFQNNSAQFPKTIDKPLIFLGRIIGWKGYSLFCRIADELTPRKSAVVLTSPERLNSNQYDVNFFSKKHRALILSKGIANFRWPKGSVHIYPTEYGEKTFFPMTVGTNVLECLVIGIPSLISEENFEGWPELKNSKICLTTDWSDSDVLQKIEILTNLSKKNIKAESKSLKNVISMENYFKNNFL